MAFMKKYTPVLTFIVVAFFVAFSFIAPGNHLSSLAVKAGTTTLSLTSEAKPTIDEGKGTLVLDEKYDSTFVYENASESTNGHVILNNGGSIKKVQATYGLTSVTATFTGSLQIEVGYESDYETQEVAYITSLVSGEPTLVSGNYWKIEALDVTDIENITFTYSCTTPSVSEGVVDHVGIVGIQETFNYAHIFKENNKIYLSTLCTYDNTKGRISTEDLIIKGDKATEVLPCVKIKTTSATTFTAYFDASSIHSTFLGSAESKIFYCHLLVDGHAFNNGNANLGTAKNLLAETRLTVNGNQGITLSVREASTDFAILTYHKENYETYSTVLALDPTKTESETNPFAKVNGGSTTATTYAQENGIYRYGNTQDKTFTTTVISNMDTTATFNLVTAGRAGRTLSFARINEESDLDPYFTSFTVNGVTDGVTDLGNSYTFANHVGGLGTWDWQRHLALASISLKEGVNTISFTVSTNTANQNQMNITGVSFKLDEVDARINLMHDYDFNYSRNGIVDADKNSIGEYDSFNKLNGGYITGTPQKGVVSFGAENNGVYKYSEVLGYTFTSFLRVEEATTIKYSLRIDSKEGRYFAADRNAHEVNTVGAYIPEMSVNDNSEAVTLSTERYATKGWHQYFVVEVATLELQAGINKISFTVKGIKDSDLQNCKLNIRGVLIESSIPVRLGA